MLAWWRLRRGGSSSVLARGGLVQRGRVAVSWQEGDVGVLCYGGGATGVRGGGVGSLLLDVRRQMAQI